MRPCKEIVVAVIALRVTQHDSRKRCGGRRSCGQRVTRRRTWINAALERLVLRHDQPLAGGGREEPRIRGRLFECRYGDASAGTPESSTTHKIRIAIRGRVGVERTGASAWMVKVRDGVEAIHLQHARRTGCDREEAICA